MSYEFYRTMHFIGFFLLFSGLAGVLFAGTTGTPLKKGTRAFLFALHGIGLLAILTGGFGMLARLGLVRELPGWIYAKLVIWVVMAIAISAAKRLHRWAPALMIALIAIGALAQWIAMTKPF